MGQLAAKMTRNLSRIEFQKILRGDLEARRDLSGPCLEFQKNCVSREEWPLGDEKSSSVLIIKYSNIS